MYVAGGDENPVLQVAGQLRQIKVVDVYGYTQVDSTLPLKVDIQKFKFQ